MAPSPPTPPPSSASPPPTNILTLPLVTLPYSSVLLPGAILRVPIDDRRDIQALLAKFAYEALERGTNDSNGLSTSADPTSTPTPTITKSAPGTPPQSQSREVISSPQPPSDFTIGFVPLDPFKDSSTNPKHHHHRNLDPASASLDDLSPIGTIGKVMGFEQSRVGGVPGAALLVEGKERFKIKNVLQKTPFVLAEGEMLEDSVSDPTDVELSSFYASFQSHCTTLLHLLRIPNTNRLSTTTSSHLPVPLAKRLQDFISRSPITSAGRLADFFIAALDPPFQDRLSILQELDVKTRLKIAISIVEGRVEDVQNLLGGKVVVRSAPIPPPPPPSSEIAIRRRPPPSPGFIRGPQGGFVDEDADSDLAQLQAKLTAAILPPHIKPHVDREFSRLKRMPSVQPEYSIQRTYIETIAEIPWTKGTEDKLDEGVMRRAREILDRDHFGLEKVKKRVLEYLAVLRLKVMVGVQEKEGVAGGETGTETDMEAGTKEITRSGTTATATLSPSPPQETETTSPTKPTTITRAPILLLVGPPGTGKTSLARSVATALSRKFHRISLGGIHSEAEIRGHRRTYIAAMPGVVVGALRKVGVRNPVVLLDEIDKVGHRSQNGDPSAALLEVLDPEQNHTFTDHYLSLPLDLSSIIFICTANSLHEIPPALLDRMETIHLSPYTNLEKFHIASRFLIPKQISLNGLRNDQVQLSKEVINQLITSYTREPGVRNLEREIASVIRAKAVQFVSALDKGDEGGYKPQVALEELEEILGMHKFRFELAGSGAGTRPGVVNGLVAFSTGRGGMSGSGAIIFIEAAVMPGSAGGLLKLTGNLGNVIRESVEVALTWVKAHAYELGLTHSRDDDLTKNKSIHVHCPAGSEPKDGPSAGVAFIVALVSLFSDRPVPATIAMTGEVSLRGRITAVGAIKEKLIGALSAGIETVVVPARNRYDVQELPDEVKRGLSIVCVEHIWDALKVVWPDWSSIAAHDTLSTIAPISSRL